LVENHKLDPSALDEGPKAKSGKLRLNLLDASFGGKIDWFGPKKRSNKRVHDLKNQDPN
jgi:hypothetical protein